MANALPLVRYEGEHPMYAMVADAIREEWLSCREEFIPFNMDDAQLCILWRKDQRWDEAKNEAAMCLHDIVKYDVVTPEVGYYGMKLRFSRCFNKMVREKYNA